MTNTENCPRCRRATTGVQAVPIEGMRGPMIEYECSACEMKWNTFTSPYVRLEMLENRLGITWLANSLGRWWYSPIGTGLKGLLLGLFLIALAAWVAILDSDDPGSSISPVLAVLGVVCVMSGCGELWRVWRGGGW